MSPARCGGRWGDLAQEIESRISKYNNYNCDGFVSATSRIASRLMRYGRLGHWHCYPLAERIGPLNV